MFYHTKTTPDQGEDRLVRYFRCGSTNWGRQRRAAVTTLIRIRCLVKQT